MLYKSFQKSVVLAVAVLVSVTYWQGADASSLPQVIQVGFQPRSAVDEITVQSKPLYRNNNVSVQKNTKQQPAFLSLRGGVDNTVANAVAGSVALALIEKAVKKGLAALNVNFPGQLAACIVLFAFLLLAEAVSPALANFIFDVLTPGSALLAKWLPVFFVPGLVLLPLSKPIGGSLEILKVLLVVAVGFVYTILSSTFSVLLLRKAQGTLVTSSGVQRTAATKSGAPAKPFSERDLDICSKAALLFGLASFVASRTNNSLETPLRTLFMGFATFASYIWGARLPSVFTKIVHPLVTSSVIVMLLTRLFAMVTGSNFLDDLATYKTGSLDLFKAGAGDILLYLLGPSVVSFALAMYSRRTLLKSNLLVVFVSMLMSSGASLYATAAFVRLLALGGADGAVVRLSVLSRNVTTALAMAVTSILGGDISIACSVVVMTGILGATVGKSFLTALGIVDPACRGLGIGGSSQGLGVAALSDEPEAFPFAAVSMVLTAVAATTLVSIPVVKESLINLATGGLA